MAAEGTAAPDRRSELTDAVPGRSVRSAQKGSDYHLQAGSPSIEAGDNSHPDLPATDIDGDPRIFDGDSDLLAVVDQGYDEVFFANTPPTVTITAPADGSRVGVGDAVTFSASALDPEDGDLSGGLVWISDLDGTIGSGGTFGTALLSVGTHLITASVVDSDGAPGLDAVTVIVKVPIQVTFTSVDTEDGWVLESSETSGVGGSFTATGPGKSDKGIRAGDDKKDRQLKGFLSFETAAIPDGAILRSADLRLRRKLVKGTSPFATHGALYADVRTGGFGGSTALEASDFEAAATAVAAATLSEPLADGDYSEGALDAGGLAAINVAGTTQLRIYFALDDDDDRRDDLVEYFSGDNTDPGNHPQLIVEYLD